MDLLTASEIMTDMLAQTKVVYLRTEPEILDFTSHAEGKVIITGAGKRVELELNRNTVSTVMGFLDASVFALDKDDGTGKPITTVLTWHFKALLSYFRFYVPKEYAPVCSLYDLRVLERFLGIEKKAPENAVEALDRAKVVRATPSWRSLYESQHLPLMMQVLPALETTPLINSEARTSVFAYYEIEGQINGRLNSSKQFERYYAPHRLSALDKQVLLPRGYDARFLCADIRHCEVTVLQWLSGDERLKELLDSGKDLHQEIYRIVTGDTNVTEAKRDKSKIMFLPVMYGCGVRTLAGQIGVSDEVAKELIKRIRHEFPTASSWLRAKQEEAKVGPVADYFGRSRIYKEGEAYLVQNFVVQSVAATVCLEKLIETYRALKGKVPICFTIHDGYGFIVTPDQALNTCKIIKPILESESKLCPGLKLKAQYKYGANLLSMKVLGK